MAYVYAAQEILEAERRLLALESEHDQLMRQAAHAVAKCARAMLPSDRPTTVLVLAGPGGNGGDALYAASELADSSTLRAWLPQDRAHERALQAFTNAGGQLISGHPADTLWDTDLVIDGLTGLGARPGLRGAQAEFARDLNLAGTPVLSVDLPSGVTPDAAESSPEHIQATVTCTFGGLRRAHAVDAACGEVVLADISVGPDWLADALEDNSPSTSPRVWTQRVVPPRRSYTWTDPVFSAPNRAPRLLNSLEPAAHDDKYSGGVVGIAAGGSRFPGAGILCTSGAVFATPSLVRVVTQAPDSIIAAHPEVIIHGSVADAGRVQAWVVGPGRGTDDEARAELAWILDQPLPVVCDADALTVLSQDSALRHTLHARQPHTVLTPHAGELERLLRALVDDGTLPATITDADRITQAHGVAQALGVTLVSKGRFTLVATADEVISVDAGHSWSATPGSGDVLAGIIGAWVARADEPRSVLTAVGLHALAAWISAMTPDGPAPTRASAIARAIPHATALASGKGR